MVKRLEEKQGIKNRNFCETDSLKPKYNVVENLLKYREE